MADKEPDDLKRGPSDDLLDPAKKKPRGDAGPSEGPKPPDTQRFFKWKICDVSSDEEASQIVNFLKEYFAFYGGSRGRIYDQPKSDEIEYEYNYSKDYLNWLLCPPNFQKDWHIAVLQMPQKELVAFIAAVPKTMKKYDKGCDADAYLSDVSDENDEDEDSEKSDESDEGNDDDNDDILMAEVKLLCILPQFKRENLEPSLFQQMAQSADSHGAKCVVYESINGFSTHRHQKPCECWSRPLNIKKLSDLNFFKLKKGETAEASQAEHDDLLRSPATTFREMELKDVHSVATLLGTYLEKMLDHVPRFSEEEVRHWFLPREGIVESYVAESDNKGITHFISFSILSFSVSVKKDDSTKTTTVVKAARSLYNASTEAKPHELLKKALELAQERGSDFFDVPNIMGISEESLKYLKFRQSVRRYSARLSKAVESKFEQNGLVLY